MAWKKLNSAVEMWETPCLGTVEVKEGERFMALCVDPSSKNPYVGLARHVTKRIGDVDALGYTDKSKLVIVKSANLLKWEIIRDLEIKGIEGIVETLEGEGKEFLGLEDPDVLTDEKGNKHVYFTIPFRIETTSLNDTDRYEICVGHAEGKGLDKLKATKPVLAGINNEIRGFKEICLVPSLSDSDVGYKFFLAETFVARPTGGFSAIGIVRAESFGGRWAYEKLVHNPEEEKRKWCAGYSSPCRIFNPSLLRHGRLMVGIMNGREPTEVINGSRRYGKFRPGLFLYNPKTGEIPWVAPEPLFKDPDATTITFASELVPFDSEHGLLYAHPNDSFVRAYRLNYERIKKMLPV
jgi:hypothetical protein